MSPFVLPLISSACGSDVVTIQISPLILNVYRTYTKYLGIKIKMRLYDRKRSYVFSIDNSLYDLNSSIF